MVRRTVRVCSRLALAAVAIVAVLVVVTALRLMAGPINLDFLKERIAQDFATPGGTLKVDADRVVAAWGGISQPIQLVFTGLRVTNAEGEVMATAPSVALSFDPRIVMQGHLLPTGIVVDRPTLDADIAREGGMLRRVLAKTDANSQGEVVDLLIDQLLAEPNHQSLLGQLDTVQVEHARVTLRDVPSGVEWIAPNAQARLKRDASGVIITAAAQFLRGGEPIDVALSGTYARDRSRISLEAKIDGLKPLMLADLSPDAALLRGIDIALSGRMEVEASGTGEIRTVTVDITGGAGTLNLPGILPVVHKVRSVGAHATVDAASHTARIHFVDVDLGAARVAVTGIGRRTEQGQSFTGRAEIKQIPVDRLGDYWPLPLAEGGRQWALANLSGGTLDVATDFALSTPGNDVAQLRVDRNATSLEYRDMTVHYMAHMPELTNVTGRARFEGGTLHFDVARGSAVGLTLADGTIDLTGLDSPPPQQQAALRLPISGAAATVEALLARPKLGLPRDMLYDPKRLGGTAVIELSLAFPLLADLAVSDIEVKAEATVANFSLRGAIGAVDLTEASGRVSYAGSQLAVSGVGKLDGNLVDIAWHEQFAPKAPYRQRYELKGTIPAALMAKAGFPSPEPYLSGPVHVGSLVYQVATNGSSEVQARLDLKGAKAAAAPLAWSKEAGVDGHLTLAVKLAPGARLVTADFDGTGGGLTAKGTVHFGADNSVQQVTLAKLVLGRTDTGIDWKRGPGGVEISVRGRSLELARVRQALKAREDIAKATPNAAAATARENSRISLQLDRMLVQRGTLGSVNGRVELAGERIVAADLGMSGGKGSTLRIQRGAEGQAGGRSVALYVADFGQLLADAGWVDGLVGGYLDLRGQFDDAQPEPRLAGTLKLGSYRMQKVTPRADVDTLNSTIDGLMRAGNALQQFDNLEARITKVGERIVVSRGHTSGPSIGMTTAGTIDLAADTLHLRGVVVPGFAINNLLSNVPLLGPLLTGGRDSGVFAIAYRLDGPLGDLKSDINMMSAMTPGALRELFIGPPDGTVVPPQPAERQPAP